MATMLEDCTTEEQRFIVRLWAAKELHANDIRKEMFPVCSGSMSRKAVHNWVANVTLMTKWLNQRYGDNSQTLLYCGFRPTGEAIGQVRQ
jgi:hypothetical protein